MMRSRIDYAPVCGAARERQSVKVRLLDSNNVELVRVSFVEEIVLGEEGFVKILLPDAES